MELQINQVMIQRIEDAANKALVDTATLFKRLVIDSIKNNQGDDTGEFIKSLYVVNKGDVVQVGSNTVQAVIMEFGRKPLSKRPPMKSLIGRANRKAIVSGQNIEDLTSNEKGIIYVIAKSIGEKGIKPRRYFMNTYEKNAQKLQMFYVQAFKSYLS